MSAVKLPLAEKEQPSILLRQRIDDLLAEAISNPLVIVSAGTGHGKTHAVSSFFSHSREQVVWVRLTALDNYTSRFWGLFLHALSSWNSGLASRLKEEEFPQSLPAMHQFLELFASQAYREERLILVFDDFHLLTPGPVQEFVRGLIQAGIESISILLISGADVDISISGAVRSIRLSDQHLRFTLEEIRIYYTALGIVMQDRQLERIQRLTEGWAFGVYLLGLHLQKNQPLTEEHIDDAVTFLYRLIDEDLFTPLPTEMRQALVLLSILDSFTLDMAHHLTGLDARVLSDLMTTVPFISFQPEGSAYYFHYLFRRFLEEKQKRIHQKTRSSFLTRTAQWHEMQNHRLEAVTFYARVRAYDDVCRLLVELDTYHTPRDLAAGYLRLLEQLPNEYVEDHPVLRLVQGYLLFHSRREAEAQHLMEGLVMVLQAREMTGDDRAVLGEACILLAFLHMRRGSYDFVALLRKAGECLPGGSRRCNGTRQQFLGNGSALIYTGPAPGELDKMLDALRQADPHAEKLLNGLGYGLSSLAETEAHYYTGNLGKAEVCAFQAIAKALERKQWDIVCNSYYMLMRISMAHGQLADLEKYLKKIREYAAFVSADDYFDLPDIAESGFYIKIGQISQAARWVKSEKLPDEQKIPLHAGRELVMKAAYLVASHRLYEALVFIDRCMAICRDSGQWFSGFKLQILKAIIYDMLEQYSVAAKNLELAYRDSHANRIVMPYIEYGANTCSLVDHAQQNGHHSIPDQWLDMIRAKAGAYAKNMALLVQEYNRAHGEPVSRLSALTHRENEVLRLICRGLEDEEIAQRLDLPPTAVKACLKKVYQKLGALNRIDAVRIAVAEASTAGM